MSASEKPAQPKSPDTLQLRKKPFIGPRLGGRALLIAVGVFVVLAGVLVFNTESRKRASEDKPKQVAAEQDARLKADPEAAEAFNRGASDAVVVNSAPEADLTTLSASSAPDLAIPPPMRGSPQPEFQVPDLAGAAAGGVDLSESDADRAARERREQQAFQLAQERQQRESEARRAGTKVQSWSTSAGAESRPTQAEGGGLGLPADLDSLTREMMRQGAQAGVQQTKSDQERKQEFLKGAKELEPPFLAATRQAPRSPYELKTGHVIPAVTLRAMNSDLPGEITGMVTENVYDTATGRHLLIPAWTKLFGKYDSDVAYGQKRALVVWTRLVFPDGSTLELGGMQGADVAGNAGFRDKVDNHYGRLIGFTLMSSVMSAGLQISQPESTSPDGQLTNRQVAAGEVGREISQLGVEIARRNLSVQPTIRVRSGYRFTITVNRDVAFVSPYVSR